MKKRINTFLLILLALVFFLGVTNYPKLSIISGYSAKKMCSCTFIAGRNQESIQKEDLGTTPVSWSSTSIDMAKKKVTSSVLGLQPRTAEYRGKLGCVLIQGKDDYNIQYPDEVGPTQELIDIPFPYGDKIEIHKTKGFNHNNWDEITSVAFDKENAVSDKKTLALIVLHKDSLIYEHYANGYDKNTEMLGWSMTKSMMNTWVGMMVFDSLMAINQTNLFEEWEKDDRKNISINNLLQMNSGLKWEEDYSKISPATKMLYNSENNGKIAMKLPLEAAVGEHWEYSSGTSNILSYLLSKQFKDQKDYLRFPYERIFGALNMKSAVLEIDESGHFIGSSYCYATARDWARYGTLYLRDGVWNGHRLLPEGWVSYTHTEVPNSNGEYGAQFWLNARGSTYPDAPHDLFSCNGYEGQRVFILPSQDLIIVRMGLNGDFNFNTLLKKIVDLVE